MSKQLYRATGEKVNGSPIPFKQYRADTAFEACLQYQLTYPQAVRVRVWEEKLYFTVKEDK